MSESLSKEFKELSSACKKVTDEINAALRMDALQCKTKLEEMIPELMKNHLQYQDKCSAYLLSESQKIVDQTSKIQSAKSKSRAKANPKPKANPTPKANPAPKANSAQLVTMKNTNEIVYASNIDYSSLCVVCNKKEDNLVNHYVEKHPHHEVFIARLSVAMATMVRQKKGKFEWVKTNNIRGWCYFCEEEVTYDKSDWGTHLLKHTGEHPTYCLTCDGKLPRKQTHNENCTANTVKSIITTRNNNGYSVIGFICKLCNYVQLYEPQLQAHLTTQHDVLEADVSQHYEQIDLVPELGAIKIGKHDYANQEKLYVCTIENCCDGFTDPNDFKDHFETKHSNISNRIRFVCPHCEERLVRASGSPFVEDIITHISLHGADLYKCSSCEAYQNSEAKMIEHYCNDHATKPIKFRHQHRLTVKTTETKEVCYLVECMTCGKQFQKIDEARTHFENAHKCEFLNIGFVKKGGADGKDAKWFIRAAFKCAICSHEAQTIAKLLAHHSDKHKDTFQMEIVGRKLFSKVDVADPTEFTDEIRKYDHSLVYCCVSCYNASHEKPIEWFSCAKQVHTHWSLAHDGAPNNQPFRYCVTNFVACHYCNVFVTVYDMKNHISKVHAEKVQWAAANQWNTKQCALCKFNGDDLPSHINDQHKDLKNMIRYVFPIGLDDDLIDKLSATTTHQKRKCHSCGDKLFDTAAEFEQHISNVHTSEADIATSLVNDSSMKISLLCCNKSVKQGKYMAHYKTHVFMFNCSKCERRFDDLQDVINHETKVHNVDASDTHKNQFKLKTYWHYMGAKVVFGNGLIIPAFALEKTVYTEKKDVVEFITAVSAIKAGKRKSNEVNDGNESDRDCCDTSNTQTMLE